MEDSEVHDDLPTDPSLRQRFEELLRALDSAESAERATVGGSLSERLRHLYGEEVDPSVSLESADDGSEEDSGYSSQTLERIAERGPNTTRYRLEREIARGGMGAVLGVWDQDLRRRLAMKVLLTASTGVRDRDTPTVEPRKLSRFLEEAQVTGQLDHPGIVPVHELGLDQDGQAFFTMKLVKGKTLKEVFAELSAGTGGWTQIRVLGVLLKICEAMSYAHAKNVIHRDLKPTNVMIGRFGEVYVMDWGVAKVLGRDDDRDLRVRPPGSLETIDVRSERSDRAGETADSPLYTMDGDVVGTPAYMPPEQAMGRMSDMGPPSDVYALGAMLYHLLAGHMPYVPPGARFNNYAVWHRVQEGPPRPVHEVAPQAPAELIAICDKAMARESSERYPHMMALAEDLSAYVEGRVVRAYETGAWAETRKWVQRNKPLAAATVAAFLLLIAGLATALVLGREMRVALALAEQRRHEAETNERIATERAEDVLRLSALQDLDELLDEADGLWPPHPENIAAYRTWIARAEGLLAELPQHLAKRAELRALAEPQSEDERRQERESHPEIRRLEALAGELEAKRRALRMRRDGVEAELPVPDWSAHPIEAAALNDSAWPLVDPDREVFGKEPLGLALALRALELVRDDATRANVENTLAFACLALGLDAQAKTASAAAIAAAPAEATEEFAKHSEAVEAAIAAATSEPGLAAAEREVLDVEARLADLEARVSERRVWRFPAEHADARWWYPQLTTLIQGLESLRDEESGLFAPDAISPEHGWSVPRRLTFALRLEADFAPGGAFHAQWLDSLPAIAAAYPGLELTPQMGLVPLGLDPQTGLWEFWLVATGTEPRRDAAGEFALTPETGMVLVLIPEGVAWIGAQADDPAGPNYDSQAEKNETPPHEVELSAFFLSKYECTQGQWHAISGQNPSRWGPDGEWMLEWQRGAAPATRLHPVEQVSWLDCMTWLPRVGLNVPSEAQWEYACRAGTHTPWWTGASEESLDGAANLADRYARQGARWSHYEEWLDDGATAHTPVGTYRENAFGLHEVHGNVGEWCRDGYDGGFYPFSPRRDPVAPFTHATARVIRGGAYGASATDSRTAHRFVGAGPSYAVNNVGVRPAMAVAH